MNKEQNQQRQYGYLLLADISGFDAYLVDVELEHAQGVMAEILTLITASLAPPMHIAAVKSDAVLAYEAEAELTRGETLLELTEATYTAFRDRLKSIARNNLCGCRACAAVPTLDLKFLVHFGEYTIQPTNDGNVQLGGLDAILIRDRLLKDQVRDGSRSYALFTEDSLARMEVLPQGAVAGSATYPHQGEIRTSRLNLDDRYRQYSDDRGAFITVEEADVIVTHDYPTTPPVLWDWLNDPHKRSRWLRWTKWRPGIRPSGRTDVGAVNHCAHGVGTIIETILDWRPYSYFTVQMEQASLHLSILATYQLEPLPNGAGTRLFLRTILQQAPAFSLSRQLFKSGFPRKMKQDFQRMEALMAAEAGASGSPMPEAAPITETAGS